MAGTTTKRKSTRSKTTASGRSKALGRGTSMVIVYKAGRTGGFVVAERPAPADAAKKPVGVKTVVDPGITGRLRLAHTATEGMTASEFKAIRETLPVEEAVWARLLSLPTPGKRSGATRSTAKLSTLQAEQVHLINAVVVRAIDVMDDRAAALEWLTTASELFKGAAPMQLLTTSTGADLVLDQLGRMEHGVYS